MQSECGFHTSANGASLLIRNGPTIPVIITFDPSTPIPAVSGVPTPVVHPSLTLPALVDTGALASFIDTTIATVLQLPIIDSQIVSGSNGSHQTDVYLANIIVPSLNIRINGRFSGVKLIEGGQQHGALLGRTFLSTLNMTYNGLSGQVTLTNPSSTAPALPSSPTPTAL